MFKYFNEIAWSEQTKNNTGLPRPFYIIPSFLHKKNKKFYLHKKVPIPFQSIAKFTESQLLNLNKENEEVVVNNELCPYCGIKIDNEEQCIIWTTYNIGFSNNHSVVKSDVYPFHLECMKQGRIFCPFMRTKKSNEFKIGKFSDLIIESRNAVGNIPPKLNREDIP